MSIKYVLVATLVLALLAPLRGVAQQATAPGEAERLRTMIAKLEPAAMVSVRMKDGKHFKATVLGTNGDTFTVKQHTRIPVPARDIRYDEVASIERTEIGMNPGQKVLIGAGAGVGGFMLLLLAALSNWD
jgi:hypothetical protein